jgi:pentose-5-phosphate-3-epimerase
VQGQNELNGLSKKVEAVAELVKQSRLECQTLKVDVGVKAKNILQKVQRS